MPVSQISDQSINHLLRYQSDAVLGTPEATRIFAWIFANDHAWWNFDTMVDNGTVQSRTTADVHIRQQHRPIHLGVGMNTARGEQQRTVHLTGNNAST
jgi:hypothetical protein